jgi:hypothetical protein
MRKYCFSSSMNGKNVDDDEEIYSKKNLRNGLSINDNG